jgi:hypothetical protein
MTVDDLRGRANRIVPNRKYSKTTVVNSPKDGAQNVPQTKARVFPSKSESEKPDGDMSEEGGHKGLFSSNLQSSSSMQYY